MKKFLAGLATAIFLVVITSISYAATFSDDFDDTDFTNSHWLDGTDSTPQTWSFVTINGSDKGYHSTVDDLNTGDPAAKIANNGKEYYNADLNIEILVRIDSHPAAYSTQNIVFLAFSYAEETETGYMAGIELDFRGEPSKDLYLSIYREGQDDQYLDVSPVLIDFDTFYKLVVLIDSDQKMDVKLYDLEDNLLGSVSSPKELPQDKGIVGICGSYVSTYNDFSLSGRIYVKGLPGLMLLLD